MCIHCQSQHLAECIIFPCRRLLPWWPPSTLCCLHLSRRMITTSYSMRAILVIHSLFGFCSSAGGAAGGTAGVSASSSSVAALFTSFLNSSAAL
mmetsp:Transcript_3597/g.12908  ORF Transcript_3597/g.12908 Transcript_3597/m.12908 type:complete len:94 (-) Transcript_3597:353-634(-)